MKRQAVLFLVAVQFLTRLPVPGLVHSDSTALSRSARYFPVVGSLVGVANVIVWWLGSLIFPPVVAIGLMMATSLLVTGALHEDGFADACDGFGGGSTSASILAIMKDSRVGAYGAMGIAMMLGLKWTTLMSIPATEFAPVVIAAQTYSRWCATALIWRLPYVRADADAKSKPLANSLTGLDWALSGALGGIVLACIMFVLGPETIAHSAHILLAALGISLAIAFLAGAYFKQRIGGYTGDCLGATQQITELGFLLAVVGAPAVLVPYG